MDLERERGITIKAHTVRLLYRARDGHEYTLNLIDTPGHVDFSYEVSRALAACEGALLIIDAAQGIEAQTLANFYLALRREPRHRARHQQDRPAGGRRRGHAQRRSPRRSTSTAARRSPSRPSTAPACRTCSRRSWPASRPRRATRTRRSRRSSSTRSTTPTRAWSSTCGSPTAACAPGTRILLMSNGRTLRRAAGRRASARTCDRSRSCRPARSATSPRRSSGWPTRRSARRSPRPLRPTAAAFPGYRDAKPMVFAGLYPIEDTEYEALRDALEKLRLNDPAFTYEPETSLALGYGFRCGFLGMLHMEIVQERLEREFDLSLIVTAPSVQYQGPHHRRRGARHRQPVQAADARPDRADGRALREVLDPACRPSS